MSFPGIDLESVALFLNEAAREKSLEGAPQLFGLITLHLRSREKSLLGGGTDAEKVVHPVRCDNVSMEVLGLVTIHHVVEGVVERCEHDLQNEDSYPYEDPGDSSILSFSCGPEAAGLVVPGRPVVFNPRTYHSEPQSCLTSSADVANEEARREDNGGSDDVADLCRLRTGYVVVKEDRADGEEREREEELSYHRGAVSRLPWTEFGKFGFECHLNSLLVRVCHISTIAHPLTSDN